MILDNSFVTLDCILTKKGRELLARNDGSFKITQFALADDEIDYTLYNPEHPLGSAYYGEAIENMPLLEAFPDESQMMKYKLVTLPRGTNKLPVISISSNTIILKQGSQTTITPQTLNYLNNVSTFETNGYVMTVADVRLLSLFQGSGISNNASNVSTTTGTKLSKSETGTSFNLVGTTIDTLFTGTSLSTTITIIGRDSGSRLTIPLIVNKK